MEITGRILFLLLFISLPSYAVNTSYENLQDIDMVSYHRSEENISGYDVNLEMYSQSGAYSFNFIRHHFVNASELVFKFAREKGIVVGPACTSLENLQVYDVNWTTLNQPGRFSWQNNASKIQALYDPRVDSFNVAAIMVSDKGSEKNKTLVAHETAHYWYDRLCLSKGWSGDLEEFAVQFEEFYKGR
jgi:hypothetical protein